MIFHFKRAIRHAGEVMSVLMENVNAEENLDVTMVINVLTVLVDVVVTILVLDLVIALTGNAVSILLKLFYLSLTQYTTFIQRSIKTKW